MGEQSPRGQLDPQELKVLVPRAFEGRLWWAAGTSEVSEALRAASAPTMSEGSGDARHSLDAQLSVRCLRQVLQAEGG